MKHKMFLATAFRASQRMVLLAGSLAVSLAVLSMALSACGEMMRKPEAQVLSYQYRTDYSFVRLERIEPGAADNAHPVAVSAGTLRQALAKLNVKGTVNRGGNPVFNNEELTEIAPHLSAALAKAGPKEDVTFAVSGDHGPLGANSPPTATTGRIFAQDGRLNIIFGRVHEDYETRDLNLFTKVFLPGSRARQIESGWTMLPENAGVVDKRTDWVTLDASALAAASQKEKTEGSAAPPAPAAADSRYQEIQNKIKTLDRLKADGLITEEEYRERRKAILQGI